MVAVDGEGSVFKGYLSVTANTRFSDVWLQLYEDETFEFNYGSVIFMRGNNVPVTIVLNSKFLNSFSDSGAAIGIDSGGALYCKLCRFKMDERYTKYDQELITKITTLKEKFNWNPKEGG